jgi:hypothetical protein
MSGENGIRQGDDIDELDESEELEGPDIVTLEDDEGNTMEFALLAVVEVDDQDYALMTPLEQMEDEAGDSMDLFLFQYDEAEDDTASFSEIEDEATYEKVREFCSTLVDMDGVEIESLEN